MLITNTEIAMFLLMTVVVFGFFFAILFVLKKLFPNKFNGIDISQIGIDNVLPSRLDNFEEIERITLDLFPNEYFYQDGTKPETNEEIAGQGVIVTYKNSSSALVCSTLAFQPIKPLHFIGYYAKAQDIIQFIFGNTMQHGGNNQSYRLSPWGGNYSTYSVTSKTSQSEFYLYNFDTGATNRDWFFSIKCYSSRDLTTLRNLFNDYLLSNFKKL